MEKDRTHSLIRSHWSGLALMAACIFCFLGSSPLAAARETCHGGPFLHRKTIAPSTSTTTRPHDRISQSPSPGFDVSILDKLRGGSDADADGISLDDSSSSASPILSKVRNIIRSALKIGDRKVPTVSKALRSLLKGLEGILGVELLPPKKKKKAKKDKGKKKKSKMSDDTEKEEEAKAPTVSSKAPTAATKQHLEKKMLSTNPNYRIQQELKKFIKDPPPNLTVKVGKNIRVWVVTMVGAQNTIYEGEVYKLRIIFPAQYPTMPPSVYFLPPNIPKHEHVYTNGDICLSLLGKDWRPNMTAESIANSILSILSSAQSKAIPMDNAKHAQNKPGQYQQDWVYHDDNC